jgi:hypothetical protein
MHGSMNIEFQIQFRRFDRVLFQILSTGTLQDFMLLSNVTFIQLIDVYVSCYRTTGCTVEQFRENGRGLK